MKHKFKSLSIAMFLMFALIVPSAQAFIIYPGIVFDWGLPVSCSGTGVLVNYNDNDHTINVKKGNGVVSSFVTASTTSITFVAPATTFLNGEAISYSGWEDSITSQCVALFITVAPAPLPVATLTASPTSVYAGSQSNLTATCVDATSASIDNGVGAFAVAAGGVKAVFPSMTTTYTLTCTGAGGTAQKSVTVTAVPRPPLPTASLVATPSTIIKGGSSALSAVCTNSTASSINGIGALLATGGSKVVSPTATITYTLTCTGAGGSAFSSAKVTVGKASSPSVPSGLKAEGQGVVTAVTSTYAVIGGIRLTVTPATILKSDAGPFVSTGLNVEYKGVKNADGTITATSIKQQ